MTAAYPTAAAPSTGVRSRNERPDVVTWYFRQGEVLHCTHYLYGPEPGAAARTILATAEAKCWDVRCREGAEGAVEIVHTERGLIARTVGLSIDVIAAAIEAAR